MKNLEKKPDKELVEKSTHRSISQKELLREMYSKNFDKIYLLVLNYSQDKQEALDIAQEVFLKAFKNIKSAEKMPRISTWLYQIAVNTAIDHLRKKSKVEAYEDALERENKIERKLITEEKDYEVHRLIKRIFKESLTPKERSIISLRYFDGLSYKEIAQIFGTSEGTVKSIGYRVFQKLKKELLGKVIFD